MVLSQFPQYNKVKRRRIIRMSRKKHCKNKKFKASKETHFGIFLISELVICKIKGFKSFNEVSAYSD